MTGRPAFPPGFGFGPLLQWVADHGIGRERSTQPGLPRWTQADLAEHLGRNERHLRRWLKDEVAISDDYLEHMTGKLLGRPPSWPELADELRAARDRTSRRLRAEPDGPAPPSLVDNLPFANPEFVGREDVLAELRRVLLAGEAAAITQAHAVTGLGGVGKTQTATAYAWRHRADYRLVWWLRAETPAGLAADYAALARPLGLDPATRDQGELVAAVRANLEATPGWLLVFDNAEDPAALRDYLPRQGGGHVLVTSRRTDWRGVARSLPLDVLPPDEAVELLTGQEGAKAAEHPEAAGLAEDLGRLPLALAQAHAYLDDTRVGLAAYRRRLAERRADLLARGRASSDYPLPVALTWQASIEAAGRAHPGARPLLELLAFMAPDAIPRDLLGSEPEAMPVGLADELDRDEAIAALARFSLLRADPETLTIHRLVQAVTRDGLDEAAARGLVETAARLINAAWPGRLQEYTLWPRIGTLLPHAMAVTSEAERLGVALTTAATLLNRTALYHKARAAWVEAEPLYRRAIAIGERTLGPDHPNLAARLNNLANLYNETGRHAEALPLYERAVAIGEAALGPEHPELAIWINNLANLYADTGRHAEALPLYERAIAIGEKVLGPGHPDLAIGINNLARLYGDTGRHAEAEPLFDRAIAIIEKALGADHPTLGQFLINQARVFAATGRPDEAAAGLGRALAILEAKLGPDHPTTAKVRAQLAKLRDGEDE